MRGFIKFGCRTGRIYRISSSMGLKMTHTPLGLIKKVSIERDVRLLKSYKRLSPFILQYFRDILEENAAGIREREIKKYRVRLWQLCSEEEMVKILKINPELLEFLL